MTVKKGKKIKIKCIGKHGNKVVLNKSKRGEFLEFTVGKGDVIPGIEKAVVGMRKRERKKVNITAKNAYGEIKDSLIKTYYQTFHLQGYKIGEVFQLKMSNGEKKDARITDMTDKQVTIDLNHPLAGKDLKYDIKILEIK
jgi:FKBP-type peptidyl-prolyl cis-trans isomerase 2